MANAPTRADTPNNAFTGDDAGKSQQNPQLDGFRGPPQPEDRMPPAFSENAEPLPGEQRQSAEPEAAQERRPDDPPPMRVDPRNAIAQRAKERREAEEAAARENLGDLNAPPIGVGLETDGQNDNQGNDNLAIGNDNPPARAPADEDRRQTQKAYTLKVNKNEFEVHRDDLIRYAGLTPEEAVGIPDISLVRAAQMNLAAEDRLAQAKQSASYRTAAPGPSPYQDNEDQRQVANQEQQRTPALDLKSAVQKIQIGDEEEAAQALIEVVGAVAGQAVANQQAGDRFSTVRNEIERDLERFASENPDIVGDEVFAASHRSLLVQEAVKDLSRLPGVTQAHVMQALNNPAYAMQMYQAAIVDGYELRKPAEIFAAAADNLRGRFGGNKPQPHVDPPKPADPRTIAKRGLVQQPARNDNGHPLGNPPPQTGRRSPSDTIKQMRRWRNQDVV